MSKFYNANSENSEKDQDPIDTISISVATSDFTIQNVCLKMGIPLISIDGLNVKNVKNYVLKCITCSRFIFDTTKLFCSDCGYPYLMKVGYYANSKGEVTINDKEPEPRNRGQRVLYRIIFQFCLPNPTTDKRATIYILSEDQLPKKRNELTLEKDFDKIIENYEEYRDKIGKGGLYNFTANTHKKLVWGYPKKNPNIPKKYYSKKSKK